MFFYLFVIFHCVFLSERGSLGQKASRWDVMVLWSMLHSIYNQKRTGVEWTSGSEQCSSYQSDTRLQNNIHVGGSFCVACQCFHVNSSWCIQTERASGRLQPEPKHLSITSTKYLSALLVLFHWNTYLRSLKSSDLSMGTSTECWNRAPSGPGGGGHILQLRLNQRRDACADLCNQLSIRHLFHTFGWVYG